MRLTVVHGQFSVGIHSAAVEITAVTRSADGQRACHAHDVGGIDVTDRQRAGGGQCRIGFAQMPSLSGPSVIIGASLVPVIVIVTSRFARGVASSSVAVTV